MALEVNGELIDDALIRAQASFLQERDPIAKWDEARERVIANTLLRQKARAEKLDPATLSRLIEQSQSGSNCISRLRHNAQLAESMAALQLDQLVGRVIGKVPKPSRKEIVSYFRSHLQQTEMPEMARVSHIVKNLDETRSEVVARAAIDEIARQLNSGADFGTLADRESDCPGAGGDLGWFPRGEMVPEFDQVVFSLLVGEVSPVFRTMFGFHIAKLTGHRPAHLATLDELYSRIENELYRVRQRDALDGFVGQLRDSAVIRHVKR